MSLYEITEVPCRLEEDEAQGGAMEDGYFRCKQCDLLTREEGIEQSWERLGVCSEPCADQAILARDKTIEARGQEIHGMCIELQRMRDVLVSKQDAPAKVGWCTGQVFSLLRRVERW